MGNQNPGIGPAVSMIDAMLNRRRDIIEALAHTYTPQELATSSADLIERFLRQADVVDAMTADFDILVELVGIVLEVGSFRRLALRRRDLLPLSAARMTVMAITDFYTVGFGTEQDHEDRLESIANWNTTNNTSFAFGLAHVVTTISTHLAEEEMVDIRERLAAYRARAAAEALPRT